MNFSKVISRVIGLGSVGVIAALGLAPAAMGGPGPDGPAYLDKIDSGLWQVRGGSDQAVATARDDQLRISRADRAVVDIYVSGSVAEAAAKLRDLGMAVSATATDPQGVVEGWLPVTSLGAAAELGRVDSVIPVTADGTDAGTVQCQCVAAHNISQATIAGAGNGSGVTVGVISDSINQVGTGVAGSQATGNLPANTVVLKDDSGQSDEGRAMSEIIFDEAPGISKLMFASGSVSGPVDKADSINQLVANGASIIADDIFYLGEPMFQDSTVSAAVDNARAKGVLYFASSGNRARQSWEGTYSDSGGFNDFDPSGAVDTIQTLSSVNPVDNVTPGATCTTGHPCFITVVLDWDEPLAAVTTNLDALLTDAAGGALPGAAPTGGVTINPTTGRAIETVSWSNTTASAVNVALRIKRTSGTRSPFMKTIVRKNGGGFPIAEFPTNSNTINPDAAASNGAITVAAVGSGDVGLNTPEVYSSRGPITRLFDSAGNRLATPDVRAKPQLAATDAVATSVPGFGNFTGTSAAAPSAAGIAAVLKSTNPNASITEIQAQMTDPLNTIACTSVSPVEDCGAGFLLADLAVAHLDRTGPVITAARTPANPNGKNGWYTKNVTLDWKITDAESPLEGAGCTGASLKKDGQQQVSCTANSGGGPNSAKTTIKRDATPPSKPKLKGLKGKTFTASTLPKRGKIKCKSKDKTSGLASCKVKGYSAKPGKHKLVAVATDKAGNKASKKFRYTVTG